MCRKHELGPVPPERSVDPIPGELSAPGRREAALSHLVQVANFVKSGNGGLYDGDGLRELGRLAVDMMSSCHADISEWGLSRRMLTITVQDHIRTITQLLSIPCD